MSEPRAVTPPPTFVSRLAQEPLILLGLALSLLVVTLLSLAVGAVPIRVEAILRILWELLGGSGADTREATVLLGVRLPRVLLAIVVGAGLGTAGAALQGLFRNPLADPGLIGVSGGAAVAAAATIVHGAALTAQLPAWLDPWLLPVNAFLGALAVTSIVYAVAWRQEGMDVATLLLSGIALNAITMAGLGLLVFLSNDIQLRSLNLWLLGSLAYAPWPQLVPVIPLVVLAMLGLMSQARPLNALLLGESEAFHIGFPIERVKRRLIVLAALAAGASVALTGIIAFVGLMVPHLVRRLLGPDHRWLLPGSALLGATLLLLADLLARTIVLPAELPVGVITSMVGGPFFLWLLFRGRRL